MAKAIWQDLPRELVFEILTHLPKNLYLKSTSLVCKELQEPSQKLLNTSIRIGGRYSTNWGQERLSKIVDLDVPRTWLSFMPQMYAFVDALFTKPSLFHRTKNVCFSNAHLSEDFSFDNR